MWWSPGQGRGDLVRGEGRGGSPQRKGCRELDSSLFACWSLDWILVFARGGLVVLSQAGAWSQLARGVVTAGQSRGQVGQAAAQQLFPARAWGSNVRPPATTRNIPSQEKGLWSFKESLWVLQRQH